MVRSEGEIVPSCSFIIDVDLDGTIPVTPTSCRESSTSGIHSIHLVEEWFRDFQLLWLLHFDFTGIWRESVDTKGGAMHIVATILYCKRVDVRLRGVELNLVAFST